MTENLYTQKGNEAILRLQNAILHATAGISELLLHGGTWEEVGRDALYQLGEAVGADSAYVFMNHSTQRGLSPSRKQFEWCSSSASDQAMRGTWEYIDWHHCGLVDWHAALADGGCVTCSGEAATPAEHAFLSKHGFVSMLLLPIFTKLRFWGFMVFANRFAARDWSISVVASLRSAAAIIGATIGNELAAIALEERERRYVFATRAGRVGIWEWDISTDITYVNPVLRETLGLNVDSVAKSAQEWFDQIHPDDLPRLAERVEDLRGKRESLIEGDFRVRHADGGYRCIRINGIRPDGADANAPTVVFGTAIDVTEQRHTEQALREANEEWAKTFDAVPEPVAVVDTDFRLVKANRAFCQQIGEPIDEMIGKKCMFCATCRSAGGKGCPQRDRVNYAPDRTFEMEDCRLGRCFKIHTAPLFEANGTLRGAIQVALDVTDERRVQRERLTLAKEQRDVLVREVHHRIKNHLQGLTGLLNQRKAQNRETAAFCTEALNQVQSIAAVYGLQSRSAGAILHFLGLVEAIVDNISQTSPNTSIQCHIQDNTEEWRVDSDKAVALALVINELMFNASKHAQPVFGHRTVYVDCRTRPNGLGLSVKNAGQLPLGFDIQQGKRLGTGLDLVRNMLPRRGAKLTISDYDHWATAALELTAPLVQR